MMNEVQQSRLDLRSDTLTLPSAGMKDAMAAAVLGDDVYEEDPTVKQLEDKAAGMFGMEAALFCPTGTMTNQLAIKAHTRPGDEVICDHLAHIYRYEGGGIAVNALCSVRPLQGINGRISAGDVRDAINNPDDIHQPPSRLVALENTVNRGGGGYYDMAVIEEIGALCRSHQMAFHLDGARLFNALVETGETPEQYGRAFDSISICLSKGLGCPVGSLLIGKKELIGKARRQRKLMGGGWRQAGILAAAGIYALDHNIPLLKEDHRRAREIERIVKQYAPVAEVLPVATNIVMVRPAGGLPAAAFVARMREQGIYCVAFGNDLVRFVTHLDFTDQQLAQFEDRLKTGFMQG
ncbi:threonine aldolase family protein [Taibaiella chishuiensis]|uniref:L-threonine aldolase n=1 Tax=Taibaiella chishuiensis TaxID=1434707 RepID=A0A2P8DAH6_9BACT|nr:GntG family PLP-dependent aldolase [Taibaiella chishuiensis]PSK94215.1 L-threonine aldolase [Taibaiella chishuiensis]